MSLIIIVPNNNRKHITVCYSVCVCVSSIVLMLIWKCVKGLVHPKMKILSVITFGLASFDPLRSLWRSDPALRFNQKYLNLCSKDERKSYRVWNNMRVSNF